jgi:hypothetical protein
MAVTLLIPQNFTWLLSFIVHRFSYAPPAAGTRQRHRLLATQDRLCGLVVRVLGYRSGGPGSIPGTTKKISGSGTGSTQPREYN